MSNGLVYNPYGINDILNVLIKIPTKDMIYSNGINQDVCGINKLSNKDTNLFCGIIQ